MGTELINNEQIPELSLPQETLSEINMLQDRVSYYKNLYETTLHKLQKSREVNKCMAKKEVKIKSLRNKCKVAE